MAEREMKMTRGKIARIVENARHGAVTKIGRYIYEYSASTSEILRTPAKGGAEKVVARV
mgnify:CR=1 FL=1